MPSAQHPSHSTPSRRATRVVLFALALVLAGCADLGIPTGPVWTATDASATGGGCEAAAAAAAAASRAESREERPVERRRCVAGTARSGGRPPGPKR